MNSVNKLKATDQQIFDNFAHVKEVSDRMSAQGFSFQITVSIYKGDGNYLNENYSDNIEPAAQRHLLYNHIEHLIDKK